MFVLLVIISLISTFKTCPTGQYLLNLTNTCHSCSSHCNNCLNYSSCVKCASNYYISENTCNRCTDIDCECDGVTIKCKALSNSKIFVIVVSPICAFFIILIVGCCICKKCQSNDHHRTGDANSSDFLTYVEPNKVNNLGILSIVMKNKWLKDD